MMEYLKWSINVVAVATKMLNRLLFIFHESFQTEKINKSHAEMTRTQLVEEEKKI